MRRERLVTEILERTRDSDQKGNLTNISFYMAFLSDKALTKFHKEYMEKIKAKVC